MAGAGRCRLQHQPRVRLVRGGDRGRHLCSGQQGHSGPLCRRRICRRLQLYGRDGQEYWLEIGVNGSHMVGSHHMLFEGNHSFNLDSDDTHGNSIYHTFFGNYGSGYRARFKSIRGIVVDDINNLPGGNGGAARHRGGIEGSRGRSHPASVLTRRRGTSLALRGAWHGIERLALHGGAPRRARPD
jgi:hypothetical protein